MNMNEEFLYYIWQNRLIQPELLTTQDETLVVESCGVRNTHSGPDFSDARIRIGETLWAGNLEIHVNASDWYKHHHQDDAAYQKVILHVVYNADAEICAEDGSVIPCLELKGKFSELLLLRWKQLLKSRKWIACDEHVKEVPDVLLQSTFDAMLVERFETKVSDIEVLLEVTNNDWEAVFFRVLARNFGFHVNAAPFEVLARSFSFKVFQKYQHDVVLLEALLFGQAGMLNEQLDDAYNRKLLEEYSFIKHKHKLQPMLGQTWKFMRMRPVNFPSVRIAQLAALYTHTTHLFGKIIECHSVQEVQALFTIEASEYWNEHYVLGDSTAKKVSKKLGKSSFDLLLINSIAPLMFVYGKKHLNDDLCERSLDFLYASKAENNSIVKRWEQSGVKAKHAGQSQALLQLKKHYCAFSKCLQCPIGNYLIRQS